MAHSQQQARPALTAHYQSPSSQPFSSALELDTPLPATSAVARKQYLGQLREKTAALQGLINDELTRRMEEDKAREADAAASKNGKLALVDDAKEEENYGEEVVEEDEN